MTWEGMQGAHRGLVALGHVARAATIRKALRASAKPVVARAKRNAPVGTARHNTYKRRVEGGAVSPGFLRASVRSIVEKGFNGGSMDAVIGVRREAFYGVVFVEEGTAKMAARPWLVPALDATRHDVESKFVDSLRAEIKTQLNKVTK